MIQISLPCSEPLIMDGCCLLLDNSKDSFLILILEAVRQSEKKVLAGLHITKIDQ